MWGKITPLSSLPCRLQAYRNVIALISPAKSVKFVLQGRSGVPISFAVSDPYLSRVSNFGLLQARSTKDLEDLVISHRVGAILFTLHPDENSSNNLEMLSERWVSLRGTLDGGGLYLPSSMDTMPSAACIVTDQISAESSAVDPSESESWRANAGTVAEPGPGAAAVQLQAWLDHTCGGWPNSFG
jgi:hypothetical protein